MIEKYKIEIDETKIKKMKKANLIVRLSVLGAYLLTVLITAIVVFANFKSHKICLREGGFSHFPVSYNSHQIIDGKTYIVERIDFINLKKDNTTETIYCSDFKSIYNGKECVASFFKENVYDKESKDTFVLKHNGQEQTLAVYFEVNGVGHMDFYYSSYSHDCFYKGEQLEWRNNLDPYNKFYPAILIELLIYGIIFVIISAKIKSIYGVKNGKKYKAINEKVVLKLKEMGFKASKIFALSGRKSGLEDIEKMLILADSKNKKIAFVDYDKLMCNVVDYKDLIDYKVIEKNGTDVDSHIHHSLIWDSTYTVASSREICKKLQLVFVLNNEEDSTIIYDLVKSSISIDSDRYKRLSKELIEITAFLDIVKKNAPKDKKFVYCKYCGTKNEYDSKKCSSCGAVVD